PLGARAVLAHAVLAVLRLEVLLVAVVDQRVEVGDAFGPDVAALAAVAAVGAAELDELLAAKADRPGATVAGLHVDLSLIEEFHDTLARASPSWRSRSYFKVSTSVWRASHQTRSVPVYRKPSFAIT